MKHTEDNDQRTDFQDICLFEVLTVLVALAALALAGTCKSDTPTAQAMPCEHFRDTAKMIPEPDTAFDIAALQAEHEKVANAIAMVESGGNPNAVNGDCVGWLQISPVMVREANRILGAELYVLEDRLDPYTSFAIFCTVMDERNPEYDIRKACRIWNPKAGEWYYRRVVKHYLAQKLGGDQ